MCVPFPNDPLRYIRGDEYDRAIASLTRYFSGDFTGAYFERCADTDPGVITANDLVAVTMLGVKVPAAAAIWILHTDEGLDTIRDLLTQLPTEPDALWSEGAETTLDDPAYELFYGLLAQPGLGRTTTSKLLAAKRPHLFPIYDSVVADTLEIGPRCNDWMAWRAVLADKSARDEVAAVRDRSDAPSDLSLLRTLDIVIWMRHRGWGQVGHDPYPPFDA